MKNGYAFNAYLYIRNATLPNNFIDRNNGPYVCTRSDNGTWMFTEYGLSTVTQFAQDFAHSIAMTPVGNRVAAVFHKEYSSSGLVARNIARMDYDGNGWTMNTLFRVPPRSRYSCGNFFGTSLSFSALGNRIAVSDQCSGRNWALYNAAAP